MLGAFRAMRTPDMARALTRWLGIALKFTS
jgi:hypothetical protein